MPQGVLSSFPADVSAAPYTATVYRQALLILLNIETIKMQDKRYPGGFPSSGKPPWRALPGTCDTGACLLRPPRPNRTALPSLAVPPRLQVDSWRRCRRHADCHHLQRRPHGDHSGGAVWPLSHGALHQPRVRGGLRAAPVAARERGQACPLHSPRPQPLVCTALPCLPHASPPPAPPVPLPTAAWGSMMLGLSHASPPQAAAATRAVWPWAWPAPLCTWRWLPP